MSDYNSLNYREQGGEKWVINGALEFGPDAEIINLPVQALKVSSLADDANLTTTVAKVNALLEAMQESGLMASE
jgi:hypothetical protein